MSPFLQRDDGETGERPVMDPLEEAVGELQRHSSVAVHEEGRG